MVFRHTQDSKTVIIPRPQGLAHVTFDSIVFLLAGQMYTEKGGPGNEANMHRVYVMHCLECRVLE